MSADRITEAKMRAMESPHRPLKGIDQGDGMAIPYRPSECASEAQGGAAE